MRIARVEIANFRVISQATLLFPQHAVLIGDNNCCKSTVLEAIDLALGPDRISRQPAIDEHDFYGGRYLAADSKPMAITVEVILVDLADEQKRHFREHLEWWNSNDSSLLNAPPPEQTSAAGVVAALRVLFVGRYDPDDDDFVAKTYYQSPPREEDNRIEFRTRDKRVCGFLFLRPVRTGSRALSLARGSSLDIILKLKKVNLQVWEKVLGELRKISIGNDSEGGIKQILKTVQDAVRSFVPAEWADQEQDLISEPYVVRLRREMNRLPKRCPALTLAELTPARLTAYFEFGGATRKTYNNRRGIVSGFLKFALQHEWIAENPLAKIPAHRIRRRRTGAQTLAIDQAQELMNFVETNYPAAVPFFALCLFAGIRPCLRTGEIVRLKPAHVRLAENIIRIDGEVSKVREPRTIAIQPNLAAWLRAYPLEKFPIIPENLQHLREKAAERVPLSHDVMRHTFISMFVAKFRSLGEAALQAGNSESIIRKHYLDLKSPAEAEKFFAIVPKRRAAGEPIAFAAGRPVDAAA